MPTGTTPGLRAAPSGCRPPPRSPHPLSSRRGTPCRALLDDEGRRRQRRVEPLRTRRERARRRRDVTPEDPGASGTTTCTPFAPLLLASAVIPTSSSTSHEECALHRAREGVGARRRVDVDHQVGRGRTHALGTGSGGTRPRAGSRTTGASPGRRRRDSEPPVSRSASGRPGWNRRRGVGRQVLLHERFLSRRIRTTSARAPRGRVRTGPRRRPDSRRGRAWWRRRRRTEAGRGWSAARRSPPPQA